MTGPNNHFEDLAFATAERLLHDTQVLIDQYGPEKGQQIAERALSALAYRTLRDESGTQPLNASEKEAVAYAVKLALATLQSDRTAPH